MMKKEKRKEKFREDMWTSFFEMQNFCDSSSKKTTF